MHSEFPNSGTHRHHPHTSPASASRDEYASHSQSHARGGAASGRSYKQYSEGYAHSQGRMDGEFGVPRQQSLFNRMASVTGHSLATGILALAVGGVGFALVKLASKARETFNADAPSLFQAYCQAFKGNMVATGVTMTTSFVALPLSRYVDSKVKNDWLGTAIGVLPFFLATTFATPKLSSLVSTHTVTQIGGACYGLAGAGVFVWLNNSDDGELKTRIHEHSSYKASLLEKIEHCIGIGFFSLLAGGVGLGITTTAPFIPGIWNTLPAGVIAGVLTFPTTLVSRPVTKMLVGTKASEETQTAVRIATSVIPVFLATALLTRVISAKFLKNQVSYFDAAAFGTLGAIATGIANKSYNTIIDERFEEECEAYDEEQWEPRDHKGSFRPSSQRRAFYEEEGEGREFRKDDLYEPRMAPQDPYANPRAREHETETGAYDSSEARYHSRPRAEFDHDHLHGSYGSDDESVRGLDDEAPYLHKGPLKPESPKNDYGEMAKLSFLAGAATALASITFLGIQQLSETYPILKGTIPTAAVGGVSTGVTLYLVGKFGDKISKHEDTKDLIAITLAFFATTALTPTVSRYISNYRVGYLKAAGLTAAAGIGGMGALIAKNKFYDEGSHRSSHRRDEEGECF